MIFFGEKKFKPDYAKLTEYFHYVNNEQRYQVQPEVKALWKIEFSEREAREAYLRENNFLTPPVVGSISV